MNGIDGKGRTVMNRGGSTKDIALVILSLALVVNAAAVIVLAFSVQDSHNNVQGDPPSAGEINYTCYGSNFGLSAETEAEIKQDWLEFRTKIHNPGATADDVSVHRYYGTYGDCAAVIMTDRFSAYLAAITYEIVEDLIFSYPDSNTICIWKDGDFCTLQEAYDGGLLTKDDLKKIRGTWTVPWATEKEIRQDHVDTQIDPHDPTATADRVWIEHNYGRYRSGCVVLTMWYEGDVLRPTFGLINLVSVAGVQFVFARAITVWHEGSFYGLNDAYDNGLLTNDDIKKISEYHRSTHRFLYEYFNLQ